MLVVLIEWYHVVLCDKEISSITVDDIEFIFIQEIKDIKTRDHCKLNLRDIIYFSRTFRGCKWFQSEQISENNC